MLEFCILSWEHRLHDLTSIVNNEQKLHTGRYNDNECLC